MFERAVKITWIVLCLTYAGLVYATASKSNVAVIIGQNAPELDKFAASELCEYLDKLFGIKVVPSTTYDPSAKAIFLVGNSDSNSLIKDFPKVSDQGVVIRRVKGTTPTLVVGGGSPRATMWAVYELAERWGVRYLLDRDALPAQSRFSMPDLNVTMEPLFKVRGHPTIQDFADSGEAWGAEDFHPLIRQLAKMKYNRLNIFAFAWQPYLAYEVDGIKRQTATLWYGYHYPITPDMPGRAAFPANAKEFWNPDLPLGGAPDQLLAAGEKLQQKLIDYGHQYGMDCVVNATVSEYPKEFAPLLGGAVPIHMLNQLTTTPGPNTKLDDPGLHKLSSTVVHATIDRYPTADRVNISINEWRQWTDQYKRAWDALNAKYQIDQVTSLDHVLDASQHRTGFNFASLTREQMQTKAMDEVKGDLASLYFFDWLVRDSGAVSQSKRPDMKFLYWGFAEELFPILPKVLPANSELEVMPDNFLSHLLQRPEVLKELSGGPIQPIINLTVDDDNIGIVPQMTPANLQKVVRLLYQTGWLGYIARERFSGDHDAEIAYLSRAAWDPNADVEQISREQMIAACGKQCGEDLMVAIHSIEDATLVWEGNDQHFAFPIPNLLMKYWKPGPIPDFFEENRKNYEKGWKAAQHAITVATPEGKNYAKYWDKRLEFATKLVMAVEATRRAATAEADHQPAVALHDANDSLTYLREAIDAYAAGARNQTDRGAIAVAVEYAYRPLVKKIADMKQTATAASQPAN